MILIAVPSWKRRAGLLALLASLEAQTFQSIKTPTITVAVVDNSPEFELADLGLARPFRRGAFLLAHEPKPGVSAARNRLLDMANAADAEFIAFIDDDETAEADWLEQLLLKQAETGADVVLGAVRGAVPAGLSAALAKHFDTAPQPAFRGVSGAHTANVLVRRASIGAVRFDASIGLVGGEDTLFFTRLMMNGARFAEAPDAIVHETVPAERATMRWLLRRWARTGATHAAATLLARPAAMRRPSLAISGLARLAAGAGLAVTAASVGRSDHAWRGLKAAARGFGVLCGAVGVAPVAEYRRTVR